MENSLQFLSKFENILKDYQPSDISKKILHSTKLVLMLAPFSGGRNTVIKELVKTGKYYYIISDTTRHPRSNNGTLEQDGVEYWFRSEKEILADLQTGKLLEAEVIHGQQVSGISIRELGKAADKQAIAITDVDIAGVDNIVARKSDTKVILLLPPSFEEWQKRIRERGAIDSQEYMRRMETASKIFSLAKQRPERYLLVINDNLADAVAEVDRISRGLPLEDTSQVTSQVLKELAAKTNEALQAE